jgi:hypothetical protein
MKRRCIANVLYRSEFELYQAVETVLSSINRRRGSALEIVFKTKKVA